MKNPDILKNTPVVLMVGYAIPKAEFLKICEQDLYPQVQGTKLMWRFIKGIEFAARRPVELIGAAPASDYPRNPRLSFGYKKWSHVENAQDATIPFINLILIKHITRLFSCFALILKWLYCNRASENRHVIVYVMHSPFILAAIAARFFFKVKVTLIVLDLPAFMNIGIKTGFIRSFAKKVDTVLMTGIVRSMDGLIVLTKHTANVLGRQTTPKLVIEGAVSLKDVPTMHNNDHKRYTSEKIVMFTGALVGLEILLSAFKLIEDPNILLFISGKGPLLEDVLSAAKSDKRIIYLGFLSTEKLIEEMSKATVFINVRSTTTPFIQYSFPSKLLEYMVTGRPTISTSLPGIPDEYNEYLYLISEETPEHIAKLITQVCSKDGCELDQFGLKARNFVLAQKNFYRQGQRIYDFIKCL